MTTVSLADMLACVARELAFRRNVYRRRVGYGGMKQEEADREILRMTAVAKVLERLDVSDDKAVEQVARAGCAAASIDLIGDETIAGLVAELWRDYQSVALAMMLLIQTGDLDRLIADVEAATAKGQAAVDVLRGAGLLPPKGDDNAG